MKRTIYSLIGMAMLIGTMITNPSGAFAQDDDLLFGQRREKIESMKTAFITRKANFTRAEAAAFWPIYNEHQEALMRLNRNKEFDLEDLRQLETLSDAEAERLFNAFVNSREEAMQLRIKFLKDARRVLPARKMLLFLQAERQFTKELLRKVQR